MRTFIIALMFIAATILPILFIPLLFLTLFIVFVIAPYVTTHVKWFQSNQEIENMIHH
jgi:hypothetical protein